MDFIIASYESHVVGIGKKYEIVTAHHGKITVRDNPAGGSIFTVKLPE